MPNVPNLPGVPPLSSYGSFVLTTLAADVVAGISSLLNQWGVFLDGVPVILADNTVSLDYRKDYVVADYPQENGAFASYDKVQTPALIRLRFSAGGSPADRQDFLQSVDENVGTLALYDIVTPEVTYTGFNLTHYDYRRSAREGAGLLVVDVFAVEIVQVGSSAFSNTQAPSGMGRVSGGAVQQSALPPLVPPPPGVV